MNAKYLVACLLPLTMWASGKQKPNIVVLIADDCRFMDLGCYGSSDAITPNIDRLAKEGLQFQRFFQATAMSSPTRQCLMTGLYPLKSGAYPNHSFVKEGTQSIVHYLKALGYRIALHGKRHINPETAFPFDYLGKWKDVDVALLDSFFKEMSVSKEPFCLFVCSNDPHMPWTRGNRSLFDANKLTIPPFIIDTPETREAYVGYLAEINQLDTDVGKVDELLSRYNLEQNTLFIFTTEQGFTLPFAKWTCYGQGLQTGFIARWPGVIKPATKTNAMCEYVDVVPTLVEVAGGAAGHALDGTSFLPVLKGEKETHKSYVYGIQTSRGIVYGSEHYAIRTVFDGRYRYILNLSSPEPFRCIQMQEADSVWASWCRLAENDSFARRQVMRYVYRPKEELYDVLNDPYELNNMASDSVVEMVKDNLSACLLEWMKKQGDQGMLTEMNALQHMLPGSLKKFDETKNKIVLP